MRRFLLSLLLTLTLILVACSTTSPSNPSSAVVPTLTEPSPTPDTNVAPTPEIPASIPDITPTPTDDPAILATLFPNMAGNTELTRTDPQGAVVVEVTPLNLGTPADQLEFDVALNTHSVDLSMDLAALATLTTDTGITIRATTWDAPRGGHHVEGKLVFPATKDGKSILAEAGKITLTIINVDVPSRIFEWELK